ncbi:bifunctional metallophosphatase/5'-nucleotidase [Alloiococcus otitis]|uniref:bifunctional metallophosphatase/5'-nucleotidase n=1 Tax=Alloiococcus otitis TaxID=1652 RepID=UPI002351FCE1|nr:metallophosphoesterase [Alloiococcus otitis]
MQQIQILSTTDVHAYTQEGLKQVADFINDSSLLIDNGDFLTGSPQATFHFIQTDPNPSVEVANHLGYDIMIPGNHDLDYGLDWLVNQVQKLEASYICANLFDSEGKRVFPPYAIKTVQGVKVGVIGLLTGGYNQIARPEVRQETLVGDALEAVDKWLDELASQVDLVLVAYHGGFSLDPLTGHRYNYPNLEDQAGEILAAYPQIDGLIAGHQHFTNAGITPTGTSYVQPGTRGRYLGYQSFKVELEGGNEVTEKRENKPDPDTIKSSSAYIKSNPTSEDFQTPGKRSSSRKVTADQAKLVTLQADKAKTTDPNYEAWLDTSFQGQDLVNFITQNFQADLYFLDFPKNLTYRDLSHYLDVVFPLKSYAFKGWEVKKYSKNLALPASSKDQVNLEREARDRLDDQKTYQVLASGEINLPQARLVTPHVYNLFDNFILWHKR